MKVKAWHIGCLVVLVLAALYFLVGTREGLDNSTTCWADPVDGGLQDPVTNETKFVSSNAYSSYMGRNMSNMSKIQACYAGAPPSPGTPPTSSQIECVQKASGTYTSLDEAKAACLSDGTCTAIISRESGDGSRPTVYSKFYEDATIVPTGGARYLGQKIYVKKPCVGSSSSASSSPSATDDPKCPGGAPGISSVTLTGGQSVRLYTAGECSALGGNFAANGAKNWGMANDSVGECLGTSNGINVGFCNQSAPPSAEAQMAVSPPPVMGGTTPMPPDPMGTAGGASMTPAVPAPTQSAASYPAYSLTCMAAPVSGMKGSVGLPETPAAWNVSQPPSGWNSKNGYTTTGN